MTTGNTTGKLSLLQGDVLSEVRAHTGDTVLRAYADANRAGQEWLRSAVEVVPGCAIRKDAVTWADTDDGVAALDREAGAMAAAGIDVERLAGHDFAPLNLPFEPAAALRLRDQTQLHPMRVLPASTGAVRNGGIRIVEGCRVTAADVADDSVQLETSAGRVRAETVVLATGTPIMDRGLHFAKLVPQRSFVAAYDVPDARELPEGMFVRGSGGPLTSR